MANGAALIHESLWRQDRQFRSLPRLAQCTYLQLLSQKDLDCAGVLTLHVELLAKGCGELTVDDLMSDLKVLEENRFIFVDIDTDELLIRSYLRLASAKSPNAYKSALRVARMVHSPKIRAELAKELRRLGRKDATETAEEISPSGPGTDPDPTPSECPPEPITNPSGGGIPSGTHPEPPVPVPVTGSLTSVGGYVGESPPEFCPKHPGGTDKPCGGCKKARENHEAWQASQRNDELSRRRHLREIADNCPICKGTNWVPDTEPAVKCDHQAASNA